MKNSKKQNGITLIALVITIIVLLILAGVSISLLVGNNGILTQASNAVIENRKSSAKEEVAMAVASAKTEYYTQWAKNTSKTLGEYLTSENLTKYTAGKGTVTEITANGDGSYILKYKENNQGTVYTFTVDGNQNVVLVGSEVEENSSNNVTEPTEVTASVVASNPSTYYGKTVNYSANGVTDWKVFYSDEDNIYLISSDYVENSKLPVSACDASKFYTYNIYWNRVYTQSPILSEKTWNTWTDYSSNPSGWAVSSLLKTSNWEDFKNDYADYVIGGAPIEMLVNSVNAKYPEERQLTTSKNEYGFYINSLDGINLSSNNGINHAAYNDTLYFPHKERVSNCYGYWLASPSARTHGVSFMDYDVEPGDFILGVSYGGWVDYGIFRNNAEDGYDCEYYGLRPIVSLKSGVSLVEGTGDYDFDLNLE